MFKDFRKPIKDKRWMAKEGQLNKIWGSSTVMLKQRYRIFVSN